MSNGEKYIEVNDIEGFKDGSYNNIPAATFNVYDMVTQEAESLTGVGRNFDGIDDATTGLELLLVRKYGHVSSSETH